MTTAQPEHLEQPHLRPIQPIPVTRDDTQLVLLRDPLMLADQATVVPPPCHAGASIMRRTALD